MRWKKKSARQVWVQKAGNNVALQCAERMQSTRLVSDHHVASVVCAIGLEAVLFPSPLLFRVVRFMS